MTCAPNSLEGATKPNSRPAFPQVSGWSISSASQEDSVSYSVGHRRGLRHSGADRPRTRGVIALTRFIHRNTLVSTSLSRPLVMKASQTISDSPLSTTSAPLGRTASPSEENDPMSGTADVVRHFPVEDAAAIGVFEAVRKLPLARLARSSRRPYPAMAAATTSPSRSVMTFMGCPSTKPRGSVGRHAEDQNGAGPGGDRGRSGSP